MSLAEIEAAAEALPREQKEKLFRFLAARLSFNNSVGSNESSQIKSKRGFPISRGRVSFGSEDVARFEAETDAIK